MRIQRVSIKTLTIGVLLILGVLPIIHTVVTKINFRDTALTAQMDSVSRVVEVATREVLYRLEGQMIEAANALQAREEMRSAFRLALNGDVEPLRAALDDPLVNGFVGIHTIDPAKLRAHDTEYRPVAESALGRPGLPSGLPPLLMEKVRGRQGPDRLKAEGVLWLSPAGPLYSVLVPLGGLRAEGYLELVADPLFNLTRVAEMVQLPLLIRSTDGERLFTTPGLDESDPQLLPVVFPLSTDGGGAGYEIVAFTDVGSFYADLRSTQLNITVGVFLIWGLILAGALFLLNRFVVAPIRRLAEDMQRCRRGDLCVSVNDHSLQEISILAANFRDMTLELRSRTENLERLSTLDSLTGIANRRKFDTVLEREWNRAQRSGAPLALLLVDIDYFKPFNDTCGHQAGDDCLRVIARAIAGAVCRPGDLVARYGGEEFAVILPDTPATGTRRAAERMMANVARLGIPHPASAVADVVTVSIGIASLEPGPALRPSDLVTAADEALYRAKAAGRNRLDITLASASS